MENKFGQQSYNETYTEKQRNDSPNHESTTQENKMGTSLNQFEAYYREVEKLPPAPEKKKRTMKPFTTYISAFMAGAVLVGGLMFGADRMNLFTGEQTLSNSISSANNGQSGAGLVTASAQVKTDSSISDVYAASSPAVVKVENYAEPESYTMFDNSDLWQYFGSPGRRGQSQQYGGQQSSPYGQSTTPDTESDSSAIDESELELSGTGTGFLIDKTGYIVTNNHVISGGTLIKVSITGYDEPLTAKVISSSSELDIAILKVESPDGADLPYLPIADSDSIEIGQWVLAIGNPYGYDHTLTMGVISATERPITIQNDEGGAQVFEHMLQTDASINPGNSGGPLLNEAGQVIGMNTAVSSEAQGIGFAIPSNIIVEFIQSHVTSL